ISSDTLRASSEPRDRDGLWARPTTEVPGVLKAIWQARCASATRLKIRPSDASSRLSESPIRLVQCQPAPPVHTRRVSEIRDPGVQSARPHRGIRPRLDLI